MNGAIVLTNARMVLPDRELQGTLSIKCGVIDDIGSTPSNASGALDCEGDYLVPGLIDLHTDNLEHHTMPRKGVHWPSASAAIAHDGQILSAGITTVFNALMLGGVHNSDERRNLFPKMLAGVTQAARAKMLRADHRLHVRCEVEDPDIVSMFKEHMHNPLIGLVSIMDHSHRHRTGAATTNYGPANRRELARLASGQSLPIASHDDATAQAVQEATDLGIRISEFPTTMDAANKARDLNLAILCGAPNVVRGGSQHAGHLSVLDLIQANALSMLSSDYVPVSMMNAAFKLALEGHLSLSKAFDLVSRNPAAAVDLDDRGAIEIGKLGDVVRVRLVDGMPVVVGVWKAGAKVW